MLAAGCVRYETEEGAPSYRLFGACRRAVLVGWGYFAGFNGSSFAALKGDGYQPSRPVRSNFVREQTRKASLFVRTLNDAISATAEAVPFQSTNRSWKLNAQS